MTGLKSFTVKPAACPPKSENPSTFFSSKYPTTLRHADMTNVQLKSYQLKTLDTLKTYLTTARFQGVQAAYDSAEKPGVVNLKRYKPLDGLAPVPFVCLRLPTGGGKTLLSAHTVRIASETYLERDFPFVLWLVPSNTIRADPRNS